MKLRLEIIPIEIYTKSTAASFVTWPYTTASAGWLPICAYVNTLLYYTTKYNSSINQVSLTIRFSLLIFLLLFFDHVLIDKRRASNILDIHTFKGVNCDSDHYLVKATYLYWIFASNENKLNHIRRPNLDNSDVENKPVNSILEKNRRRYLTYAEE